jgi:hypothetical protein
MISGAPDRMTAADRLVSAESSTPTSTSVPGPCAAAMTRLPEAFGVTIQTASDRVRLRARSVMSGKMPSRGVPPRSAWVMSLIARNRSAFRRRSRASRTNAAAYRTPSISTGVRLTSTAISLPSRRRPESSRPTPMSRGWGVWKKDPTWAT